MIYLLILLLGIACAVSQLFLYKKIKELEKKIDVLVRVTHSHDQFIDSVKKKADEFNSKIRKGAR